ncbi:MAG: ATP-dependent helicase, partial [Cyanobacteria bacterium K_DeepCast_35m_m2_023]|nr:ATP-dependent helicase [Cyanobacteria bacterium K_DeepCast_35m_m2_023]
ERALLAEILQRIAQETGCSSDDLALAALELSLAGQPLLLKGDEVFAVASRHSDMQRGDGPTGGRRGAPGARGDRAERCERSPRASDADMDRFRIELGWRDRIKPGNIVGAIANETGLAGKAIGRIQIFDTHSMVDLPKGMPPEVFEGLRQLRVLNKPLQISRVAN